LKRFNFDRSDRCIVEPLYQGGWVHDRFGTGWMLQTDGLSAILFVVVGLFFVKKIQSRGAQSLA
jgi:predicted 3-demethylubiquinone-9 3-methyltransferase (glyoxalase superfamily)